MSVIRLQPSSMHPLCFVLPALVLGACSAPIATCAEGTFACLGECKPLGTVCGDIDGGGDGAVTNLDGGTGTDTGGPDGMANDIGGADASADVANDGMTDSAAADAPGTNPCASAGGTAERACSGDGQNVLVCSSNETQVCGSEYHCVEWSDEGGTLLASCVRDFVRACSADESEDSATCDGNLVLGACHDNQNAGNHPWEPAWTRSVQNCRRLWPTDGTCEIAGGSPRCTSPTAESCNSDAHRLRCSMDGRSRVQCAGGLDLEYIEPCADTETCRECGTDSVGAQCIPNSATPSDHVFGGPGLVDELYCTSPSARIVSTCGWQWNARCGSGQPVCHDELDGGAHCYPSNARFCEIPGTTECSDDLAIAFTCRESGYFARSWCAGLDNVCERASGRCYPRGPFRCELGDDECLTPEVRQRCEIVDARPEAVREFCPGGCTDDGAVTCSGAE